MAKRRVRGLSPQVPMLISPSPSLCPQKRGEGERNTKARRGRWPAAQLLSLLNRFAMCYFAPGLSVCGELGEGAADDSSVPALLVVCHAYAC